MFSIIYVIIHSYSFGTILSGIVSGISKIKVRGATYILLRVRIGVVKKIRRAAIATGKASSWHKFGTGSYLLLWIQGKIGQMFGYWTCIQSQVRTLAILCKKMYVRNKPIISALIKKQRITM